MPPRVPGKDGKSRTPRRCLAELISANRNPNEGLLMAKLKPKPPIDLGRALIQALLTNERINQVLLEIVTPDIWRAQPPCVKRRNIATSFAHMHNVRCMKLKMSRFGEKIPERLDRAEITIDDAKQALGESAAAMVRLIGQSLADGGHVPNFRPDVVSFVCSAITHDAHHRGQICHWAAQLGTPLTPEQSLKMWEW